MSRLVLAVAATLLFAGCVSANLNPLATAPGVVKDLLPQKDSLWPDHQNAPHPSFGWPTLTHPATSANAPAFWKPIPAAPNVTKITGLKHLAQSTKDVKGGAGIALFGSLALVPSDSTTNYVVDISDPSAPKLLSKYDGNERGAAIMAMPDGRLYGVVSTGPGFDVVNLTDPTHAEILTPVKTPMGGHKLGLVPGTPIVYNANSRGGGPGSAESGQGNGETEIYDLSDPAAPVLVQEFKNGFGCHHIFFWISAEKQRALCAGIEVTQIWDIADPKAPKIISQISMPLGKPAPSDPSGVIFSHTAFLNEKGDVLIVGDELDGGAFGVCDGVHTPAGDKSALWGNLWFYDIKDEKNPKMLGWFSPPPSQVTDPRAPSAPANPTDPFGTVFGIPGCTAHHGRLVPDPEGKRQLVAMAWYSAGVVLIDFTDPANAKLVDEWNPGTNTWEAWYDNGYIFTGDLARGLDVLTFK